jgi:hypothetical protein
VNIPEPEQQQISTLPEAKDDSYSLPLNSKHIVDDFEYDEEQLLDDDEIFYEDD